MRLTGSAQDDGAGLGLGHAAEVYQPVLANHDLLDQLAVPQLDLLWVIKGGGDLPACMPLLSINQVRNGQGKLASEIQAAFPSPRCKGILRQDTIRC